MATAVSQFATVSNLNQSEIQNYDFDSLVDLLTENWEPAYSVTSGQMQNFISVFSVYFPASIGILAGANVSGDLRVTY